MNKTIPVISENTHFQSLCNSSHALGISVLTILKKMGNFNNHYIDFFILGICPGDKVPSAENELWCTCSSDAIEAADHKCIVCTVDEEVPNEDQTECVGMWDYCLSTRQCCVMLTSVLFAKAKEIMMT